MKILIVGSGGREHALAWKCAQSPKVSEVLVAPGNGGTATEPRVRNVERRGRRHRRARRARASPKGSGSPSSDPKAPLVAGVVDAFAAAGLRCFGPTQGRRAARRLQGLHQGIPQAPRHSHRGLRHVHATTTFDPDWVRAQRTPIVVKASGLAAGKGVLILDSAEEAIAAARSMFDGQFGAVGR